MERRRGGALGSIAARPSILSNDANRLGESRKMSCSTLPSPSCAFGGKRINPNASLESNGQRGLAHALVGDSREVGRRRSDLSLSEEEKYKAGFGQPGCSVRGSRNGPGSTRFVNGDEGEDTVGHLFPDVGAKSPRPGFDMNSHRGAPDALDFGVDAQHVADAHRANECHRL